MPLSRSKVLQRVRSMLMSRVEERGGKRREKRGNYLEFLESRWLFSGTAADFSETIVHNEPYIFVQSDFTNAFTTTGTLTTIEFTSAPSNGTLTLDGAPVQLNTPITIADLTTSADPTGNGTILLYTPVISSVGTDTFAWEGSDDSGTTFSSPANITITTTDLNAPVVSDTSVSTPIATAYSFASSSVFSAAFQDADTTPPDTIQTIEITSLPQHGNLTLGNLTVSVGQEITASSLANTPLVYTPSADYVGPDTFGWNGSDGAEYAASGANLTVEVVPASSDVSENVTESTPQTIPLSDFATSFGEANANASLASIKIASLPADGTLTFNGTAVTANEALSTSGDFSLVFTPTAGFTGSDEFTWEGSVDGVSYSAAGNGTLTVSAPTASNITTYATSGVSTALSADDFSSAFSATGNLTAIAIVSLPKHGTLTLNGAAVKVNQLIPVASISNLVYTSKANYIGADSFLWTGSNGYAGSSPASDTIAVSSVFGVLGNATPIVNGEKTPTAANFTDFGSMTITPDASMQLITRTYTIRNGGTAALTLSNLTVSGANASDFVITSGLSNATLQPGETETFTVRFAPTGAGKRSATISLSSNIGAFTFAVQGTGLVTTTVPTTAAATSGVVQVATTKAGSGAGATNGQIMLVTYTGYLADGTVFDSSFTNGLTGGIALRLDNDYADGQPYLNNDQTDNYLDGQQNVDGGVIPGWEYGLQGIKVGEKRVLIINSDAGYGSDGSGSIPGGATLIFEVQCVKIIQKPMLAVAANYYIAPGSMSPNNSDGTLLTIPSGSSSTSQTFTFYTIGTDTANGTALSSWSFKPQAANVSGDRKDFGLSLSADSLSVTFHPLSKGNKFLTITVNTTDPVHPHYKFRIEGTTTDGAFIDLATGFSTIHVPRQGIVSGSTQTIRLPVLIGSESNEVIPAGSKTNIQIYAAPAGDTNDADKVLLAVQNNVNVSGMAPNGRRRFNLAVTLPQSLATGSYNFVVVVNSATALGNNTIPGNAALTTIADETGSSDNTNTSSQAVLVTQGTYTLAGSIVTNSVTAANGTITGGGIVLDLKNTGNIPFTKDQLFTVELVMHPSALSVTDTSEDVVVGATLAGTLKLGQSKNVQVTATSNLTGFASGIYLLEAEVVPSPAITLTNGATPIFDTTASGLPVTLTIS